MAEGRKRGPGDEKGSWREAVKKDAKEGKCIGDRLFTGQWPMWTGAVILSLLSIVLFAIQSPWGSSGGLLNLGQNLFHWGGRGIPFDTSEPFGVTCFTENPYAMLTVAMFFGAMGGSMMSRQFGIRVPPAGELVKGLLGGLVMGFGVMMALGCTISAFYSAVPALSAGGLVFLPGMMLGAFIGARYLVWEMEHHPGMFTGKASMYLAAPGEGPSKQPVAGFLLILAVAIAAVVYYWGGDGALMGFMLVGLLIGFVLQRSRFCIVKAMREPFITGDSRPARGVMLGILVALVGFTALKASGFRDEELFVVGSFWLPALLGGIIFGIGMTLAGGCTVGSTWRAGEGQVKLMLSLVGIVLSMPLIGEYLRPWIFDRIPEGTRQVAFLPDTMGYVGAICAVLLMLLLWNAFVRWNERTGKLSAI